MDKKELEQMEKYWEKYHKSIPDYPLLEQKRRRVDLLLSYLMAFLVGVLFVLGIWLIYQIRSGL